MMTNNYIDIGLALLVLLSVLGGWQRGVWRGLCDLLSWIGSLALGLRYYQPVARWLAPRVGWPEIWNQPAAFILTATLSGMLLSVLGYALLARLPKDLHSRFTSRLVGVVPGLISGLISAAIAATILLTIPLPAQLRSTVRESRLANQLAASTERFEAALKPIFSEAIAQTFTSLTVRPDSDESVDLPYTVSDAPAAPELEEQMLALVNQARAEAGLDPVVLDAQLTTVARQHSLDMFARGYFAHNTPEGRTPFDRIDAAGISYRTAGENLALAPTLTLAHTGLMNSPGHRANILRPEFGRVGIGILDGGVRGLMVTQNFRD